MSVKKSIYLSGPIEFTDDAYAWRNHMYRDLQAEYDIIIPDLIPCPYTKDENEYGAWVKKHFVLPDMKDVATSEKFFVYIDHVYSSGTYGELSVAAWLGKDIVCFLDGVTLESLPMWVIGCLDGATFVNSIEDGIKHYKEII
jgi:hypothetical protein